MMDNEAITHGKDVAQRLRAELEAWFAAGGSKTEVTQWLSR